MIIYNVCFSLSYFILYDSLSFHPSLYRWPNFLPFYTAHQDVAHQALLSMEFSRQEYWSGLLFPTLGDLPNPGIESASHESSALAGQFLYNWATWEATKWTGMGKFNSDDHYIYYWGQESLRKNQAAIIIYKTIQNAVLGCNLKNDRMISDHFQGKSFNITVI